MTPNGYSYSEAATASSSNIQQYYLGNTKMQSFDQSSTDIYNLTTGMEMIEFPPKNLLAQQHFFNKPTIHNPSGLDPSSSTKAIINEPSDQSGTEFYQPMSDHPTTESSAWSDQSLRCIFPCEGNEKPSQGLSLSLSSSNPSRIGLQSFELRQQHDDSKLIRDGFFDKSINIQDGFLGKNGYLHYSHGSLRSKYLVSAQELLNEFCNLPDVLKDHSLKGTLPSKNQWKDDKKAPLNSLDLLELQKRKTRLLQMLEEVDRRYNNYSNQMKSMVSSFEAVAGNGAAKVYSALASKAMSRHFRCLRDEIVSEIKSTKKEMGEKDINSSPATRGETPRLRILDQTLRQQRAFQQMNMMETHPWRPLRGLPERSVSVLRAWLFEHFLHPYPSDVDKHILSRQTGLSRSQVSNWFINARVRLWKPMVEEMYIQEMKDQENTDSLDGQGGAANLANLDDDHHENVGSQNPHTHNIEDQKPTLDQLVRIDSESLSSIINTDQENSNGKNDKGLQEIRHPRDIQQHHDFSLGAMEMDFSSYNHSLASGIHYGIQNPLQNYGGRGEGGGTGVSLTLGLQQHGGSGVSLAFSSASQNSLLYTRDHIDQHIQYSLLDNEGQDLQYRNLMSSQMLHDLG